MLMNRLSYIRIISLLMFLSFMLWGCAVGQGPVRVKDDQITHELTIGKTTKEDTLKLLGKPGQIVKMANDLEIWIYNYTQIYGLRIPFAQNEMENSTLYIGFKGDLVEKTQRRVGKTNL
jgi:hypothetical protein